MKYDEFISQVEQRTDLASREEAERATQAALEHWRNAWFGGGAKDLVSQLPAELAQYLRQGDTSVKTPFLLDEFFWRVSQPGGVDLNESTLHARVVIALLSEVVTMGEIENVKAQLPEDFAMLFEVENEGGLHDFSNFVMIHCEDMGIGLLL